MSAQTPLDLQEPAVDDLETKHRTIKVHYHKDGGASLTVPGRNLTRLDTFLKRRCSVDLLTLGIYPDAKEISEAETMRRACCTKLAMSPNRADTLAVVVGDGRHPRLGALLAFTTGWEVISIDPLAKRTTEELGVRRLTIIREYVQNLDTVQNSHARWSGEHPLRIVLCAPHSHAKLIYGVELVRRSFNIKHLAEWNVVAMPCCERQYIPGMTCDHRYQDLGCWSDKASVQIWRRVTRRMIVTALTA